MDDEVSTRRRAGIELPFSCRAGCADLPHQGGEWQGEMAQNTR
jgi:hypothetical protein